MGIILIGIFGLLSLKTSFTISQITRDTWKNVANLLPSTEFQPQKDPDRINVLLIGIRGPEDPGEGKLLADAIILVSFKKSTGQIALISIPRDLYVKMPYSFKKDKINAAYALGEEKHWRGGGLKYMKEAVGWVTGVYIDYAVSIDFKGFEKLIDALGGIEIYLAKPFEESIQWSGEGWEEDAHWFKKEIDGEEKWVFYLPAGQNVLDGKTALYYVRSRYSTNDFDRMARQQQVLLALKDKLLSLGFLANPFKIYKLLDIIGKNVITDFPLTDLKKFINIAKSIDLDKVKIKKKVFQTGKNELLYASKINGLYVLLPKGNNFARIREECQGIFNE